MKMAEIVKISRAIGKPVQQYKSLEGNKKEVLKEMGKLASRGWRVNSFGWSNGFQGGWYALMTRDLRQV